MRQTSQAATEQQGLRDVERWKDKIEIRLDNRQVAFLFFGSALIACLLFILGVIVGKRLESRGHALAPEIEDPLALLDRVASSLPAAATVVANRASEIAVSRAQAAAAVPPSRKSVVPGAVPAPVAAPAPVPVRALAKVEKETIEKVVKAEPVEDAPPAVVTTKLVKKPEPAPEPAVAKVKAIAVAAKPAPVEPPHATANPELLPPSGMAPPSAAAPSAVAGITGSPAAAGAGVAGRGRFMLQVGSFLDRAEAEAFASSFASEHPVVITSDIPGKGTWFRVRVGDYHAFKEAVDAKLSFEHRFSKIALVVGPL